MPGDGRRLVSLDDFADQISKDLTREVLNVIELKKSVGPEGYQRTLVSHFVCALTAAVVTQTLFEQPRKIMNATELQNFINKNFAELKRDLQTAVAAGFEGAMSNFVGRPVEYACTIQPVPEVVNRRPC